MPSAEDANADLRGRVDQGMTLVASYWSGDERKNMAWLDSPCGKDEVEGWSCTDAWVEHPEWPWVCNGDDIAKPTCADAFTLSNMRLDSPSPPPAPPPSPPAPLTYERGVIVGAVSAICTLGALAIAIAAALKCMQAGPFGRGGSGMGGGAGKGAPTHRPRGFEEPMENDASLGASSGGAGAADFKAGRRLGGARAAGDAADGWPLMPSGAGKVISLAEDGELEELEPPVRPVMLPGKQRSESPLEFDYF